MQFKIFLKKHFTSDNSINNSLHSFSSMHPDICRCTSIPRKVSTDELATNFYCFLRISPCMQSEIFLVKVKIFTSDN